MYVFRINIGLKWVALLFHMWEGLSSNYDSETEYSGRFPMDFLSHFRQIARIVLGLENVFHPHQFIFH